MDRIRERFLRSADDQLVQLPQKRRQGLPGSGRSEYERVGSARDRGPTLALRIAWLAERLLEPSPYDGMKARQHGGATSHVTGWGWGLVDDTRLRARVRVSASAPPIREFFPRGDAF